MGKKGKGGKRKHQKKDNEQRINKPVLQINIRKGKYRIVTSIWPAKLKSMCPHDTTYNKNLCPYDTTPCYQVVALCHHDTTGLIRWYARLCPHDTLYIYICHTYMYYKKKSLKSHSHTIIIITGQHSTVYYRYTINRAGEDSTGQGNKGQNRKNANKM